MSTIKSYSVGSGDTYYIKHNSDNFTIIDSCLSEENREEIVADIKHAHLGKSVTRFISTHPDDDHFRGLRYLDENLDIPNFYCVKNKAIKLHENEDFDYYCELRDSGKVYHIEKDCKRKWMNQGDDERGPSGIQILWPKTDNPHYVEALRIAESGGSPNNISAIIKYSVENGVTALWMGDLETDFMEKVADQIEWPEAHILFAPHHGRHSGRVPHKILDKIKPKVIVLGEAPSRHLNYYGGYDVLTQNSTGDIVFECQDTRIDVYVYNEEYDIDFLDFDYVPMEGMNYLGTLHLRQNE